MFWLGLIVGFYLGVMAAFALVGWKARNQEVG